MRISDSAVVTCSYDQQVFNKSKYQSQPVYSQSYTWQQKSVKMSWIIISPWQHSLIHTTNEGITLNLALWLAPRHQDSWRSEGTTPCVLNLGKVIASLLLTCKLGRYSSHKKLGVFHRQCGCGGEQRVSVTTGNRMPVVQNFLLYWLSYSTASCKNQRSNVVRAGMCARAFTRVWGREGVDPDLRTYRSRMSKMSCSLSVFRWTDFDYPSGCHLLRLPAKVFNSRSTFSRPRSDN
jgi:hypothetical protein